MVTAQAEPRMGVLPVPVSWVSEIRGKVFEIGNQGLWQVRHKPNAELSLWEGKKHRGKERARCNRLGRVWQAANGGLKAANGGLKAGTRFEFLEHPAGFVGRETHHWKGENKQRRLKVIAMG